MDWLVILALAAWAWWQNRRLEALARQLAALEARLDAPVAPREPAPMPAAANAEEPLLLDTPIPEPSNDIDEIEPPLAPREDDVLLLTEALPPLPDAARPDPPASPADRRALERWIAENGLAWLGGGSLALGGILFVAFATQQSWFTPLVQLYAAGALGSVLIGLSEWLRRAEQPNPLIAALLAGAGVATLYATAWGAHALYGMIGPGLTAALLAAAALLLVGLSFRHGQALGVLAVLAALFAPVLAHSGLWPYGALTLFLGAVAAAGFALAALQRWAWVAAATLTGLYFWFAAALSADDVRRALALLSFTCLGGVALALRKPIPENTAESENFGWREVSAFGPTVAICVSSVALIWTWLAVAASPGGLVAAPAWVGALFVALAAYAVRVRVAPAAALAVAIGALTLGLAAYLRARFAFGPLGADFYPFILFAAASTALSAIAAKPHRKARALLAGAGAIGAALLTALAASSRLDWHAPQAWAPLAVSALMLYVCAGIAARDTAHPREDDAVDFWAGAASVLLLLFVESLFGAELRAAAHASLALSFAAALAWRGWRALRLAALAAAGLALVNALSPALVGATVAGALPLWQALLTLALAAGFLFCGAMVALRQADHRLTSEALSSAGVMLVLIGVFLVLRWVAAVGAAPLDRFSEDALRALALMAAGHLLLPRAGVETGSIAAWRGHALMSVGLLYAICAPGLFTNPWWGADPAIIVGPPLIGALTLAFAAPAGLALWAAQRLYPHQRDAARLYGAAGAVLALLWAVMEIRVGFQGANASSNDVGLLEGAGYALLALAAALAVAIAARWREPLGGPLGQDLRAVTRGAAWSGLVIAALILLVGRHAWWGAHDPQLTDALETGLAVLAQAGAAALALGLGRALSLSRESEPTRFAAAAAAILFAWSFGHAALRWLYHQGGMDDGAPLISLEGYAHALWPLAFVLAGAELTRLAPGRDTVRAYLYDLQAIWAAAVWPGLVFAALGLWVLYNPWWGALPARVSDAGGAFLAVAALLAAAALSLLAMRVPKLRLPDWFARTARIGAAAHVLTALTLIVRATFQGGAIAADEAVGGAEMWTYSALLALYGAALLGLGMKRDDAVLRWCGLALLLATTAKVFMFDMAQLSGFVRVASFLGLGAVLTATAYFARRTQKPPAASP